MSWKCNSLLCTCVSLWNWYPLHPQIIEETNMGDKNKKEAFHILSHTCFYIPRLPGRMMEVIKYWVICAVSRQICTLLTSVWNYWIDNTCPSLFALVNSLPKREEHVLTPEIVCTIIETFKNCVLQIISAGDCMRRHNRVSQEWPGQAFWNRWPFPSLYKDRQDCM